MQNTFAALLETGCLFAIQRLSTKTNGMIISQGTLKGTNLRGQTEPKRRFSLIFADSRLFIENKAFGKRIFSQKTTDFRRKLQKTAGTRRKPQIGVCPLRFVPLSAALISLLKDLMSIT